MLEFFGSILAGLGEFVRKNLYKLLCVVLLVLLVFSLSVNDTLENKLVVMKELAQQALDLSYSSLELAYQISMEYSAYKAQVEISEEIETLNLEGLETLNEDLVVPARTIEVTATAYCPCVSCCGIWSEDHPSRIGTGYVQRTSSGTIPTANRTIATDPDVIPEGTKVLLNGITYVAEDTGSGVKGNHIDIYFDTHEEAVAWGLQTVEVTILED